MSPLASNARVVMHQNARVWRAFQIRFSGANFILHHNGNANENHLIKWFSLFDGNHDVLRNKNMCTSKALLTLLFLSFLLNYHSSKVTVFLLSRDQFTLPSKIEKKSLYKATFIFAIIVMQNKIRTWKSDSKSTSHSYILVYYLPCANCQSTHYEMEYTRLKFTFAPWFSGMKNNIENPSTNKDAVAFYGGLKAIYINTRPTLLPASNLLLMTDYTNFFQQVIENDLWTYGDL